MYLWTYMALFLLIVNAVEGNDCTVSKKCSLQKWVAWVCSECCLPNAAIDAARQPRVICCPTHIHDLDTCLHYCNMTNDQVERKGLCSDHCTCPGGFDFATTTSSTQRPTSSKPVSTTRVEPVTKTTTLHALGNPLTTTSTQRPTSSKPVSTTRVQPVTKTTKLHTLGNPPTTTSTQQPTPLEPLSTTPIPTTRTSTSRHQPTSPKTATTTPIPTSHTSHNPSTATSTHLPSSPKPITNSLSLPKRTTLQTLHNASITTSTQKTTSSNEKTTSSTEKPTSSTEKPTTHKAVTSILNRHSSTLVHNSSIKNTLPQPTSSVSTSTTNILIAKHTSTGSQVLPDSVTKASLVASSSIPTGTALHALHLFHTQTSQSTETVKETPTLSSATPGSIALSTDTTPLTDTTSTTSTAGPVTAAQRKTSQSPVKVQSTDHTVTTTSGTIPTRTDLHSDKQTKQASSYMSSSYVSSDPTVVNESSSTDPLYTAMSSSSVQTVNLSGIGTAASDHSTCLQYNTDGLGIGQLTGIPLFTTIFILGLLVGALATTLAFFIVKKKMRRVGVKHGDEPHDSTSGTHRGNSGGTKFTVNNLDF